MAELTIHVHHHFDGDVAVDRKLDRILLQGVRIMALSDESKGLLGRIDTATNNIAADLRGLKDKIGTGEDTELKAELDRVATQLEGIAASTEDPVPNPEP